MGHLNCSVKDDCVWLGSVGDQTGVLEDWCFLFLQPLGRDLMLLDIVTQSD